MASDLTFLIAAGLGTLGPTLAGLAAWNSSRQNASQASVDEVHSCLDALRGEFVSHTENDRVNFAQIERRLKEQADTADVIRTELVEEAEAVRSRLENRADALAEYDHTDEGYRTTPEPPAPSAG